MASATDYWLIRLPDGRVVRSRSTALLRQQVRKGRVPKGSRVRRAAEKGWHAVDEIRELTEAVPTPNGHDMVKPAVRPRTRRDFSAWRSMGVRGLMRELFDALDSTLHRGKLALAFALGALVGILWIGWHAVEVMFEDWQHVAAGTALGISGLLAGGLIVALITQITFIELSRLRQPQRGELWPSCIGSSVRLATALLIVVGAGLALVVALRALPGWMLARAADDASWWHYGAAAVLIARLILEVLFWPILALAPMLLGPILVVEDCSVPRALLEWWRMLRSHLGRIYLYEALAMAMGLVFTAPLVAPVVLASYSLGASSGMQLLVGQATLTVLTGIALTPLFAYLLVANVFIYLNLRYQFFHSAR